MFRHRADEPNRNIFNDHLNCRKVMSGCRGCSGRLFHSVGPAVTKQWRVGCYLLTYVQYCHITASSQASHQLCIHCLIWQILCICLCVSMHGGLYSFSFTVEVSFSLSVIICTVQWREIHLDATLSKCMSLNSLQHAALQHSVRSDLWPRNPLKKCLLTWWIFVPSFTKFHQVLLQRFHEVNK